jgi:predicted CoA-binding protein
MITRASINAFVSQPMMALAGVSRDPKKFGNTLYKTLAERGYRVVPVHPEMPAYDGSPCFRDIESLPAEVSALVINTSKSASLVLAGQALQKGITHIWFQQGSVDPRDAEAFRNPGNNIIYGKCILMFTEPVTSVHRFHRNILKFFRRLPR